MRPEDSVRILNLVKLSHFPAFEEQHSFQLGLENIQILQQFFCDVFDMLDVVFVDVEEGEPACIVTGNGDVFQVEDFAQPLFP